MRLSPAYKLTIGNQLVDTTDDPQASTVIDLKVLLDMDVATDMFSLVLGNVGHLTPEREDDAVIELGYADEESGLQQVIAARVEYVTQGSTEDRITGHSAAAVLLNSFADQTFENKTAGTIVQALASDAGVDVSLAEPGINFPAYVIDGQRSIYHHMHALAGLCGFDLYLNSDNEIVFRKFIGGNTIHLFDHAIHIIELEVENSPPRANKIEVWGESGTNNGAESWAWLTKDFNALKGTAGQAPLTGKAETLLLEKSSLRTGQAAQTTADAVSTDILRRQVRGRLLSMGRPQVRLGDAIRLTNLPEAELNQTYQVRSIKHNINKKLGFISEFRIRSVN